MPRLFRQSILNETPSLLEVIDLPSLPSLTPRVTDYLSLVQTCTNLPNRAKAGPTSFAAWAMSSQKRVSISCQS